MGLKEKIKGMDTHLLALLVLVAVGVIVFLCLIPFFFFDNPGVPLGWLLGTAIEVFNYWSIVFFSGALLSSTQGKKARGAIFSTIFVFLRFALWIGGLALGALCTFTWQNNWCNVWSVFAAYVPMTIAVALTFIGRDRSKTQPAEKEESHE